MKNTTKLLSIVLAVSVLMVLLTACKPADPYSGIDTKASGWQERQVYTKFAEILNSDTPQNSKLTSTIVITSDRSIFHDKSVMTVTMEGIVVDSKVHLKLTVTAEEFEYEWQDTDDGQVRVDVLLESETVSAEIWLNIDAGRIYYSVTDVDGEETHGSYTGRRVPDVMKDLEQYLDQYKQLDTTYDDVTWEDIWDYMFDNYSTTKTVYVNDSTCSKAKIVISGWEKGNSVPDITVYVVFFEDGTYRCKQEISQYIYYSYAESVRMTTMSEIIPTDEQVEFPNF